MIIFFFVFFIVHEKKIIVLLGKPSKKKKENACVKTTSKIAWLGNHISSTYSLSSFRNWQRRVFTEHHWLVRFATKPKSDFFSENGFILLWYYVCQNSYYVSYFRSEYGFILLVTYMYVKKKSTFFRPFFQYNPHIFGHRLCYAEYLSKVASRVS